MIALQSNFAKYPQFCLNESTSFETHLKVMRPQTQEGWSALIFSPIDGPQESMPEEDPHLVFSLFVGFAVALAT